MPPQQEGPPPCRSVYACAARLYFRSFYYDSCLLDQDSLCYLSGFRQPPAFPYRLQYSIIGRPGLNLRVRDGNGCAPRTHRRRNLLTLLSQCPFTAPGLPCTGYPPIHFLPQQSNSNPAPTSSPRKEVIQPHLPIRLPCYDFTPVTGPAFGSSLLSVGSLTSGISDSHGVTGGVYKTRERIHRGILIRDY